MYAKALLSEFSTSLAVNIIINIIINIISIINITIIFISIINTKVKMSDSSLSPPLMSEPSLPILPPVPPFLQPQGLRPLQLRHTASQPRLPKSDS
jgi:hypothetical protein